MAAEMIEAAAATFELTRDTPEAAVTRHWIARVRQALHAPGAAALVQESAAECAALGLVAWPGELTFGAREAQTPAPRPVVTHGAAGADRLSVTMERLSVRGMTPSMLRSELVAVVADLFPGCSVTLERIDGQGETLLMVERGDRSAQATLSSELCDGLAARLRLSVGGPVQDGARGVLRVVTTVASLALEVASLRGFSEEPAPPASNLDEPEVPGLVVASPSMRRLRRQIAGLGGSRATVVLQGESGTGKEVIASAIHALSARAMKPFIALNCAAVPRELFEGQLFGYRRGAFTGALADHAGVVRQAEGGTLFVDEVGELPLDLQAKLLRFLENREVLPLGESRAIQVDVRVIAATHQDLAKLVRESRFREDLYYRLYVVPLHIPPLRERPEDVAALARHFVRTLAPPNIEPPVLGPDAVARLVAYAWPGNVRELRNVVERCLAFSPLPRVITAAHIRIDDVGSASAARPTT